jgi:prolyl-tRNA synthetase
MGTIVECLSDATGIVWPLSVAPFIVHLLNIGSSDKAKEITNSIYERLQKTGIEVLCDDRDIRAGEKFADSDLLGIPLRVIISEKTIEKGEVEVKERISGKVNIIKEEGLVDFVKNYK